MTKVRAYWSKRFHSMSPYLPWCGTGQQAGKWACHWNRSRELTSWEQWQWAHCEWHKLSKPQSPLLVGCLQQGQASKCFLNSTTYWQPSIQTYVPTWAVLVETTTENSVSLFLSTVVYDWFLFVYFNIPSSCYITCTVFES